ncbi:location of vulva defective 1-like isoform X1 [Oreochromis aureus]|uniref:location of vulva defective 1-like isoform X1 n=1 Tax=Oreochromis aureus TaxID=47969 RepID=UPI00195486F8|nr:location of vulva defective 1-like isoform X1 [Oreochromis aureus]
MAGHLLFVILMSFVHEIQAQAFLPPTLTVNTTVISERDLVTFHCQAPTSVSVQQCFFYTVEKNTSKAFSCLQNFTATELLLMSHQSSPAEVKVKCFYTGELNSTSAHSEPSSITIQSQKPQMRVQHFNGEQVQFVCSLPGSVKDDTRCNLYFGEASRSVLTATVWKKSSTETKQRFCQFYVSIDDFLRHLHFVQQKEASCDYTLKREPRSLSPRSDQYNLTAILESESPKINKPSSIMTTESSLSKPTTSSSTTSVNSPSGLTTILSAASDVDTRPKTAQYMTSGASTTAILESEPPKINKPSSIMTTESSLSNPSASTSTTSVNSLSGLGALNLSATTGVNTPAKTTQYITSGDRTTELNLSSPSASSPTTSVNSPSDPNQSSESYETNTTVTVTVKGLTFTSAHTSTYATATSVGQERQPDNKVNSFSEILESEALWKLAVAVTGFGVTMGVILLVLGLLTFKRRSETSSQSRTKAASPGDFLSMTKMNHGGMLPAGNDGDYSVITSVPDNNYLTREKLNLEQTKNEDSDIYHVYATISEETDPPDSQETIYSMLNAH